MSSDWPKIWHKNDYDVNLVQNYYRGGWAFKALLCRHIRALQQISSRGFKSEPMLSGRDVIDSRQVDAPLSKTLSIVASIRLPYRCNRIDKIYPQMPLHLGVKLYRVLRLSAVRTRKNSWAIARSNKSTAVTFGGNVLRCTTAPSRKYTQNHER